MKIEIPDWMIEVPINSVTHIHSAGKIVTGKPVQGHDVYRAEQDVEDILDVNGDGSVDLDDLSEFAGEVAGAVGDFLSDFL